MNTLLCVGLSCGSRPHGTGFRRTAARGLRLCTTHYHELKAILIELPVIHDDCESSPALGRNPILQRVSGSRYTTGITLDEEAIATRFGILGFLSSWSALVAEERAVTKPARRHPVDLTSFLLVHLNWILAHPAAADFAEEICRLATRARRSAYIQPAQRINLGQCIHPGCDATMTATPTTRDSNHAREIRCDAGHTWQPHQWLQLSRRIRQTGLTRNLPGPQGPEGTA